MAPVPRSGASQSRARYRLALGIERAGLVGIRFPAITAVVVGLIAVAAALGIARIKIDDSLSQLFRSDTPAFRQYEQVSRQFPSSEFDVLVVVDGKGLLQRQSVEKLRNLATDLQLVSGTRGAISMFSARQPPQDGQLPAPLFPDQLPTGEAYDALVQQVMSNEIVHGKLVSPDGQLTLMVVALEPHVAEGSGLSQVVAEIHKTVDQDLSGSGLHGQLSGAPVMRLQIRNAVERARFVYNTAGFAAGCLIALAFFRRLSFMAVAAVPPLTAILFALGALGWLDFHLNILLNMMAPLIMVISFSDSMQLTFAARDRLIAGEPVRAAYRSAILVVGPACALTHATAALSFVSLLFSKSDLIREFGEAGILATSIALFTVLTLVPLLGLVLSPRQPASAMKLRSADFAIDALRALCAAIAGRVVSRPARYSLMSLLLVGTLALFYAQLHPRWALAEEVPAGANSVAASHLIDQKLTGANPIDVLIQLPRGQSLYAPATLATIAEVHAALEKQPGVGNVWSLETLRRWLAQTAGTSDIATLKEYVNLLPRFLVRRFISANQDAVVVSARVPDAEAVQLLPIIDHLNRALGPARAEHPDYRISVTGLPVIAAYNSANMIESLNRGLTIEILFIAVFVGLAFRSMVVALAVILPAVFPVVLSGDLLWGMGDGLQFASVVALTVSFGLSMSATIHFLNRMRLEDRPDEDPAVGVARATVLMGPALILTTVVLACALAATAFSSLPSLRLFGWLSAFAMVMALTADLFILRPIITFLGRLSRRLRSPQFSAG